MYVSQSMAALGLYMHSVRRVIAAVVNGELPVHDTGHRIHTLHACPSYSIHYSGNIWRVGRVC